MIKIAKENEFTVLSQYIIEPVFHSFYVFLL